MLKSEFESKMDAIVKANKAGEVSDNVSVYIGFSLIFLGVLNGIMDIPDAFIIGASLSGVCFTMADITFLNGNFKKTNAVFTAMGVFCLFLLPIILLVSQNSLIIAFFEFASDMGTFYAIGFVMIALGWKSREAKSGFITGTLEVLRHLKDTNEKMKNDMASLEEERREIVEDYRNRIDQLEKELEVLKELSDETIQYANDLKKASQSD